MSAQPISIQTRWLGAALAAAAIVFQALWLGLPAVFLSVAMLASYGLWIARGWTCVPRLRPVFGLAVATFLLHASEEFITGLQSSLPGLFGRPGWSDLQYLVFNLVWVLVFAAAAAQLKPGRDLPVLVALFFAVAGGVGNGTLHLALVLSQGHYFPGAWTAPLCLAVGVWMLRLLYCSKPKLE